MSLHPEAEALLGALSAAGLPPFEHMTVPQARGAALGFLPLQGEPEEIGQVEHLTVDGPAGDIPIRVYAPAGTGPFPVIVYFHGGGWVIGDLDVVDTPLRNLAHNVRAVVVSVGYRRAPESRFPAAFDDCLAATEWAAKIAADYKGDPSRLVVAGDSAGGNLAAGVSLAAHESGSVAIAAQVLLYPVTDFDFTRESYIENAEGKLLTPASMQWFWAHYLGAADFEEGTYALPNRVENLAGLPPAFVATAECDVLRDEGEAYAARLDEAGVLTQTKRYEGMIHGFFWALGALPSGAAIYSDIAQFLDKVLPEK
ncbi:alpha/beta hydrolase [Nocardioides sp. Root151]|uniref:alpha/beta hydrolase n=1 Tax=Nocardioides sp. Root151 TaxID=1736475 RepID=UPI000702F1FF|nr:alpha/beta hydrolase [Nocardioides sp. Root151]KQZ72160.1 lipase [Nocardioides sp. Root151]